MASIENPIANVSAVNSTTSHANPIYLSRTTSLGSPIAPHPQPRVLLADEMPEIVQASPSRKPLSKSFRPDVNEVYELPATEVSITKSVLKVINNPDNNTCVSISSQTSGGSFSIEAAAPNDLQTLVNLGLSFGTLDKLGSPKPRKILLSDSGSEVNAEVSEETNLEAKPQFNRWMRNIQKRRMTVNGPMDKSEKSFIEVSGRPNKTRHQKSSSESSSAFVTAVKSASISLASFSIAPTSKRTGTSSRQNKTNISSKASNVGRQSEDNSLIARTAVVDQGVTNRLLQRRHVLEELIATEENYVADVKFLQNVSKRRFICIYQIAR